MKKVFIAFLALVMMAGSALAATWHVDDDGATYPSPDFSSVQDAINAASDGDTILVADGYYPEQLVVNKELRIEGESRYGTIIDASSFSGYGITVTSSNTEFESFTLIGPSSLSPTSYGFHVAGGNSLGFYNLRIRYSGRTGLDLHGVSDVSVIDVVSEYNGGAGIAVTDSEDVSIYNAKTGHNAWGGIALFTSGVYYPPGGSNQITIVSQDSSMEPFGLYKEEKPGLPVTNLQAKQYKCWVSSDYPVPPNNNYFTWYFETESEADNWMTVLSGMNIEATKKCRDLNEIPEFTGIGAGIAAIGAFGFAVRRKNKRA